MTIGDRKVPSRQSARHKSGSSEVTCLTKYRSRQEPANRRLAERLPRPGRENPDADNLSPSSSKVRNRTLLYMWTVYSRLVQLVAVTVEHL